jgi:hypothetical protein
VGGIEERFFKVLGQEEIFGATACRVLCLEMAEQQNYIYIQ